MHNNWHNFLQWGDVNMKNVSMREFDIIGFPLILRDCFVYFLR